MIRTAYDRIFAVIFFSKCLQVTPNRVLNALNSIVKNPNAAENREKAVPHNKTSDADRQSVRDFIDSIPKYESHYGRVDTQRKYLNHNLTKKEIVQQVQRRARIQTSKFCQLSHFSRNFQHRLEHKDDRMLYSDSCGGQNRNIKLALLLKKFLANFRFTNCNNPAKILHSRP